jgi:S-adenosylmethionine:tRNA ribosyltransferase-isomerase
MRTDDFDFELPEERIALRPASPRDAARMLVVAPGSEPEFRDCTVLDLPGELLPGDVLVFNDTRVIPAALDGVRVRGAARARISVNLHKRVDASRWRAFVRPARKLELGEKIEFGGESRACMLGTLSATVTAKWDAGEVELAFDFSGPVLDEAIAAVGTMPLPPYIAARRTPDDADHAAYQTLYARHEGAVAAPTAGLHFTERLFEALDARGIDRQFLTLHVGAGTFLPVKSETIADHPMHAEWGEVSHEVAAVLNRTRDNGGRIVAVGTTVTRLLETATGADRVIQPFSGETDIFITPGSRFHAIDGMMTNFHLPRSTLFMLVSAFSGLDRMKRVYTHAIATGYRFYSYGDASLLWPNQNAE